MGFVIYDVETSGLNKRFDQILQFAAVRTDERLEVVERVSLQSRLRPHVLPAPEALQLTGTRFQDLVGTDRPGHDAMVGDIYAAIERWAPAMFIGFNSISFDEEMLRQAFYEDLRAPIFATSLNGNARGDALKLARAVAALRPDVLNIPRDAEGRRVFRLSDLALANGIDPGRGHEAMADVETTLALCQLVKAKAPTLWSSFMRFANKRAVVDFVREEDAFAVFEFYGGVGDVHCVTRIGINPNDENVHYCLDLTHDVGSLRRMSDADLLQVLDGPDRPVRRLKVNASPLLAHLWELEARHLGDFVEDDLMTVAQSVRGDEELMRRLTFAMSRLERQWPKSLHVEQQIYDDFISKPDAALCAQFHRTPWEERPAMVTQFRDKRLQRLAQRLLFFERPDVLAAERRAELEAAMRKRLSGEVADAPWRTNPQALEELDAVMAALGADVESHPLGVYRAHLVAQMSPAKG